MTDLPRTETGQPWTVLLMMPDDIRGDESCAADWLRRVWVTSSGPDEAIPLAQAEVARICEWDEPRDLEPVAIYPGHIYDLYQP